MVSHIPIRLTVDFSHVCRQAGTSEGPPGGGGGGRAVSGSFHNCPTSAVRSEPPTTSAHGSGGDRGSGGEHVLLQHTVQDV